MTAAAKIQSLTAAMSAVSSMAMKPTPEAAKALAPLVGVSVVADPASSPRAVVTSHDAVVSPDEYPTKDADRSYNGISHSGTTRARMDRDAYVEAVQRLYDEALAKAETDAQKAALLVAIDKFKSEYLSRTKSLISVRSGTYSGHIAGRSGLNARQANAGNSRLDKALSDFSAWQEKAEGRIMQAVMDAKSPEQKAAEKQAADDKRLALQQKNDDFLRSLLAFKKGDDLKVGKGKYTVVRTNKNKDGVLTSITLTGEGVIKGVTDKIEMVGAQGLYRHWNDMQAAMDRIQSSSAASPVYYHGSDSDTPMKGSFTYLVQDAGIAKTYGKKVHAVTASVTKTLDMTDMETAIKVFDEVFPDIDGEDVSPVGVMIAVRYGEDEMREWAQSKGYDSILLPTTLNMDSMILADKPALVVFDPAKIKKADVPGFDSIDDAAHQAATSPENDLPEPTDGQKLAGTYKMGRIRISGLDIAIENPQGSVRSGVGADGKSWSNTMQLHYGYINGSHGADGDHVDVFVMPGLSEDYDGPVYVIDQIDTETGDFDEHKVIIGAYSQQAAKAMYLSNYDKGWKGCGDVTMMPWEEFREWVKSGDTKGPVGEVVEVGYDSAVFDDIWTGAPSVSGMLSEILTFNDDRSTAERLALKLGVRLKDEGPEVDMFGDPIQPPEGMGEDLFGDDTEMPAHLPIDEIPLHEIGLSADVPQFKSGADDETGVVEPLGGKFDRTGVAPIQLWKRRDGRYEVISGRHRLDLARRSGEKTIPSQVHHEDRGFDSRKAAMLDAELNIRDGQGKVRDYVDYFTHSGIDDAAAEAKGLLARHIGQRAFVIAKQGGEDLIAAHKAEIISDQAAADIAGLAPGNAAMQAVGIRAIQEGKPIQTAVNTMRAVMALARESGQVADTMDLFGFDDSALREAENMAKLASRKQRQINEQLASIKGAAKRPEMARKQGVSVEDPEAVRNRVVELTALKHRWDNWSSHSDLLAEIRTEISKPGFDSMADDDYWLGIEEVTGLSLYDAATALPATSAGIQTEDEARAYWAHNFLSGNPHRIECKYGKRKYVFHVRFTRNHAYTDDVENTGQDDLRVFDLPRAQGMDHIWAVIRAPDAIIESDSGKGNRQFDKKIIMQSAVYGRVILSPKPDAVDIRAGECTHFDFVSWHEKDEKKHASAVKAATDKHVSPIKKAPSR